MKDSDLGLTSDTLTKIIEILAKFNPKRATIFGSRVKGNYTSKSDVDIAIVGDKIEEISKELIYLNSYKFHIIDMSKITNKDLLNSINKGGKVIYYGR